MVSKWDFIEYAEDGDLSIYEPIEFLDSIKGDMSAPNLYRILQEADWVDKNGLINNWIRYSGRYLTKKYHSSNIKKLRKIWRKYGHVYTCNDKANSHNNPDNDREENQVIINWHPRGLVITSITIPHNALLF